MTLEIYPEDEDGTTKRGSLYLRLIEENTDVCLVIVDHRGKTIKNGYILRIFGSGKNKGCLHRCFNVDRDAAKKIGIKLDAKGRIEEEK